MGITQSGIEDVLRLLIETPKRITAVTQTLTPEQHRDKPDAKSWSINDILAHLRACADVWSQDIEAMLTQDSPTLRHISPRTYLRKTNYPDLEFGPSFQVFCDQRAELLAKLNNLPFADWARDARIKGRQHTVFSQARRLALHEASHCEQVETIGKML